MEGFQKFFRTISKDSNSSSSSTSVPDLSGGVGLSAALSSSDQSRFLVPRPPRQGMSLLTCSKLCAFFFIAGVFVGYTIKRRIRNWASKLLKRLKD